MNLDLSSSSSKRQKSTNPKQIIQTHKIKHKNTRKSNKKKNINEYCTNKINPFMYIYINQIIQNKINPHIPTKTQLNQTHTKQN